MISLIRQALVARARTRHAAPVEPVPPFTAVSAWFGGGAASGRGPVAPAMPALGVPRYPPVDPGIPNVPVADILHSQRELIERLQRVCALDDHQFRLHGFAPVQQVARYIHLLPASAHDHFSGPGGLFRFCLELAFHCRQAADARLFVPHESAEERRRLEPKWKYACFLAGLLSEVHRPLGALVVTDSAGRVWPSFMCGMDAWLREGSVARYHVGWHAGSPDIASSLEGAAVFGDIISKDTLSWLNAASPALVREVYASALGHRAGASGVAAVVSATRERVLQVDVATRQSRYGLLRCGHHLEHHLLAAIRHLARQQSWAGGADKGPLWLEAGGLFLSWPDAADSLRDHLLNNGVEGIPRCAFTMAEVLGRAGVLTAVAPGEWLWPLPGDRFGAADRFASNPNPAVPRQAVGALRFADPRAVLGYTVLSPGTAFVAQAEASVPSSPPSALSAAPAPASTAPSPATVPSSTSRTATMPHAVLNGKALLFTDAGSRRSEADVPWPVDGVPSLTPLELRLAADWQAALAANRGDLVVGAPDGGIAVSVEAICMSGTDPATVAKALHRRRWLGRGPWPGEDARVGPLAFDGGPGLGLVVNALGVRQLGLAMPND